MKKQKRLKKTKACLGCGDHFFTFKNYDYCVDCAVNHNRYATKSPCSECDGSGIIKFRNQPPRPCKLCYLTKSNMNYKENKSLFFWKEADQQTNYLIADILQQTLPLTNLRDKKIFDLHKDADYRSLLMDYENQLADLTLSELKSRFKDNHPEPLSENIAYDYFLLVIKSLVRRLRNFGCHDESYLNF